MNKIWVVTQQGIPIMAYNQSEVTPMNCGRSIWVVLCLMLKFKMNTTSLRFFNLSRKDAEEAVKKMNQRGGK